MNRTYTKHELEILKKVYEESFDVTKPLPKRPDYNIEIQNNGISLPGSIVQVSGYSKTMKSTLVAKIVACCLGHNDRIINTKLSGDILWFDTEQSPIEFAYFHKTIYKLANLTKNSDRYFAVNIRKFSQEERLFIVHELIRRRAENGRNIDLIVIDGVADLVASANDYDGSKSLIDQMVNWSDNYQAVLFALIHTNKDKQDSTGHLGHFLDKKCSYHIRTSKNEGSSQADVVSKLVRMGEGFEPFSIEYVDGIPTIVDLRLDYKENNQAVEKVKEEEVKKPSLHKVLKNKNYAN